MESPTFGHISWNESNIVFRFESIFFRRHRTEFEATVAGQKMIARFVSHLVNQTIVQYVLEIKTD